GNLYRGHRLQVLYERTDNRCAVAAWIRSPETSRDRLDGGLGGVEDPRIELSRGLAEVGVSAGAPGGRRLAPRVAGGSVGVELVERLLRDLGCVAPRAQAVGAVAGTGPEGRDQGPT